MCLFYLEPRFESYSCDFRICDLGTFDLSFIIATVFLMGNRFDFFLSYHCPIFIENFLTIDENKECMRPIHERALTVCKRTHKKSVLKAFMFLAILWVMNKYRLRSRNRDLILFITFGIFYKLLSNIMVMSQ